MNDLLKNNTNPKNIEELYYRTFKNNYGNI